MKVHLAWLTGKAGRSKEPEIAALVNRYVKRISSYCEVAVIEAAAEEQLFGQVERLHGRAQATLLLLDSRGERWSSEEWADHVRRYRDGGAQHLIFAVGPADGWSPGARQRAATLISLGPMTLSHELARLVLAEQVYRAFSILAGHPYHCGHTK